MSDKSSNMIEPIAIIGTSCRFPGGSNSPSKLWELLKNPVDVLTEIPPGRFNAAGFYHENAEHPGTTNVTKAYLLDGDEPWAFDNEFFNISAREAESMDPQQRIILETVYESVESAGYSIPQLRGSKTGVFVGQMSDDYRDLILRDVDCHPQHTGTGIARSILANRVSYAFDWKGPSLNIDTACSSSLVALHLAVQSLRSGECEMAVVAGVNLVFSPELFSFLSSLRMLSPTGRSRMWDASADGYARGEGFAAVIIKTLKRAQADGDDIESIIRNTGVNQDGRSAGLTVPSAAAQAELMKSTYAACGLDCEKEEDRCQYFEAHGTGTQAGDPKEAEGITKIHVGSIKTVIGHLEGTAGLASLLKASLATQHGLIPPNLHFDQLNPAIEPYYRHLEVPTRLKPWPTLPAGAPRRASVNSFGFGGTNAHVIVESWEGQSAITEPDSSPLPCWGPFVLSANSETALTAMAASLSTTLNNQSNHVDLSRLAWTLQTRRTQFTHRASFAAGSKEELVTRLDSAIKDREQQSTAATKATKLSSDIRILGVFTGQGAQWVTMGASLFLHSITFRRTIQQLESSLEGIPQGPTWFLTEELLRRDNPDRTLSAEISQPLCTAIQVALVDLLKECDITFSAVVGHSSGEIAAAYAAGVLEARDAILIAYYRGYHSSRAKHKGGTPGKMMAVGMSPEDAEAFCQQPRFLGRISVAARNSPSSTTLSGDSEAIDEAKLVLDEKAVFSRALKVDTAYHSHHMERVRKPYLASLKEASIQPRRNCFGESTCNWYSSVHFAGDEKSMAVSVPFEDMYWVDNMVSPVLFFDAINSVTQKEQFDLVLEVGPHPALRGPATESVRAVRGTSIPYSGVLERNQDALKTFSSALGFIWRSGLFVDFAGFRKACEGPEWIMPRVLKGLPPYPWDHDRPMLKESKKSKAWRTCKTPIHELLGYPTSDAGGKTREVRWRNILRLSDVEWLQGHRFQNQVLLPAAGYLAMAVETALHLVGHDQPVQLIELQDVVIHNGITLEESSPGVEMNLVIRLTDDTSSETKTAEISCHAGNADAGSPEFDKEVFTCRVIIQLGPPAEDILPSRVAPTVPMTDVTTDRFYSWMQKIGLQYSKPFVLDSIKRRLNLATVAAERTVTDGYTVIHPGTLDSILQGLYAAFSYPGDGRVWTTYLPRSFRRVRFNPSACGQIRGGGCEDSQIVADCYLTESSAQTMRGDIDAFCTGSEGHAIIQIQGAVFASLEVPAPANDRSMFWKTIWQRDVLSAAEPVEGGYQEALEDSMLHEICERTAYFYLKQLCSEVGRQEVASMESHFQYLMEWALDHVLPAAQSGQHPRWKAHWDTDTVESITRLKEEQHDGQIDLELIHHLGPKLPSIVRGLEPPLQLLKEGGMLESLYTEGLGVPKTNGHLGTLIDHLVHQYPSMQVLEIGAGTGGSTSVALKHLGTNLRSYTFTDLSPSFFPAARTRFTQYERTMNFQVLDIERSPIEQDFRPHSFDLIIAAHVLHATRSISQTLQHCRELLRPGGYLILLEPTSSTTLRIPFLFSTLPGWWLGREDGRKQSPTLTEAQWNVALRDKGLFSGVDHVLRDFPDDSAHTFSVMISQAVDDRISLLRDPLNPAGGVATAHMDQLLIISGHTLAVSKLAAQMQHLLAPFAKQITVIPDLEDVQRQSDLSLHGSAVVCLSGLEEATWARAKMNQHRLSAMQSLFRQAKHVLWATRGCRGDDPYASMMVGIARSVSRELAHLRLKLVDLDRVRPGFRAHQPDAVLFSEMLLQMACLDLPGYDDDDGNSILWSNETEVAVEDGVVLTPRVVPDDELNDSFNSARRVITRGASLSSTPVEISVGERGIVFDEAQVGSSPTLRVISSSLFRFACSGDSQPFYISLGHSTDTMGQDPVLAISPTNGSVITVESDSIFACKGIAGPDETLSAILTVLLCESVLEGSPGTVWIHDADDHTAEILFQVADQKNIPVFLTTSNSTSSLLSSKTATYIHPRATERGVRSLIPHTISRFVNMRADADGPMQFAQYLVGDKVDILQGFHQVGADQIISLSYSKSTLMNMLEEYCSKPDLLHDLVRHQSLKTGIKANLLHEQLDTANATTVISWTDIQSIQVRLNPPANNPQLFSPQKTYFLVGLTGDVGLSLCEYMATHGAQYLALASRTPSIPPESLAHLRGTNPNLTIRIFSLDISDMSSLKKVRKEITASMPPIAGVANGALVVRDHPFDSTSLGDFDSVFKPKVLGSQNLDALFYSTRLDFFVLFSSVASIVGKPAQSSYNAANLFMAALVSQRRKRGLPASVMHFGMLVGFGFIHGQAAGGPTTVEARFRQDDLPAIPETDFHAVFAQAVLSGRVPGSGFGHEVIAGLGTEIETPWRRMARFGHCRVKGGEEILKNGVGRDREQNVQSIQDELEGVSDCQGALTILKTAVAGRVGFALGLTLSEGESINEHVGLISLGLDSLVAVEIRSWLLKMLEVDVPVLKFLSGSSLSDICQYVLGQLSDVLKPWAVNNNGVNGENNGVNGENIRVNGENSGVNGENSGVNGEVNGRSPGFSTQERHVAPTPTPKPQVAPTTNGTHKTPIPKSTRPNGVTPSKIKNQYERVGDMSHAQAQLYFLQQYLQNNAYNVAYSGHFHGQLDITKLQNALWTVGKRHEAMRSAYFVDTSTSRPVQAVLSGPQIILEHRTADHDNNNNQIQDEIDNVKNFKFEIDKGILMKVTILSQSPSLHFILFSHHHIALDGVAWSVFISDVAKAYSGGLLPTPSGIRQSIDMAKRQLNTYGSTPQNASLAFWKSTYKTIPEPLPLFPFAKVKTRPAATGYSINTSDAKLPSALTKLIEKTASNMGVTSFHFYLAALAAFLARCLNIDDLTIGVVNANRTEPGDEETVGYFLDMLPVRLPLTEKHSESFDALAKRARDAVLASLAHSRDMPFDKILNELGISSRPTSRHHHPLFQAAINYRRAPLHETDFGTDGKIKWDGAVPGGNPYDLFLNVAATSDWTFISFITQDNIYRKSDGDLLLKWYIRALEALVRNPSVRVAGCPISNESDIAEAKEIGCGPSLEVPWMGTLTDRVDEVVDEMPHEVAIKDDSEEAARGQRTLTYAQMSNRMKHIAGQLQFVPPGSHVAMLLDPVADAVCCILAILRLGLVWIPLDTRNHHQRIRAVVEESRPRVLVCHDATEKLAGQICKDMSFVSMVNIDDVEGERQSIPPQAAARENANGNKARGSEPAMILYTSGSTGVPKGVVLTHRGLVNQIYGTTATLKLGRETTLQQSPLGFDLMLDQIFLALCNGGTVVMVGKSKRGDPARVAELMVKHGVSLTHFVPSEYLALLNYGHHILKEAYSWRYAMSGGEKLGWELRRAFRKLGLGDTLELVNVYGPAEITLACARGVVPYQKTKGTDGGDIKDHLRPSPNYRLEITDADMHVLPVGFPGEICISGPGVGLGYLERPEESSRKFVRDKYRSGDKGRLLPDGTLEVLGRLDQDGQVKIHGFRVELDEIANAIVRASNGAIVNAAASLRPGEPSGILVAFVVFDVEFAGDKPNFIQRLRSNLPLPPVMKPAFIVPTDRIPANSNGKTDRAAVDKLPITEPVDSATTAAPEHNLSPWEQSIKEAWEEVLSTRTAHNSKVNGHKQAIIQPGTDFFQAGGSSILMIKLKSLLETQFGVTVSMPELFQASTLSSMAALIESAIGAAAREKDSSSMTAPFLGSRGAQAAINWDLEIAALTDGLPWPSPSPSAQSRLSNGNGGLKVVLTGATGFVGRHLLSHLIQDPRVAQVHCLAIRPDESGRPRHLPIKSSKVIEHPGDLSNLSLGLSNSQFATLSAHASIIIHNGADVSLLKTYQSLRRANVVSTRTLCEMAIRRRVPIHYVSTASVAKVVQKHDDDSEKPLLEVPASPVDPALLNSVDGYAASKWMSEKLLEKVAEDNGLPAYIHRLAHVVGDDASELDAMGMLIKYSLLLRALPRIEEEDVTGRWDFVTVDEVVKDLVESAIESASTTSVDKPTSPNRPVFVNHCARVKTCHHELREYLEGMAGESLREIGMREWLAAARDRGMNLLVYEFFAAFEEGRGKMVLPGISKGV
ncbi:Fusarin C synthetase [Cladorrhinum sp. PSN332]|nr:Fusarin C synthetase [Cladorrhinum sp. PSN332]